jgi:hypothetical protein
MIKGVFIWRFRMDSEEMFIKATRKKMRFPYKGQATVEDLWDLPVTELDKIFKLLNAEAKKAQEESLLETKSEESEKLAVRIGIIKYIVSVKLEEKKEAELAKERKEQKQKIMEILASKHDEELKGKSVEELEKMLEELK